MNKENLAVYKYKDLIIDAVQRNQVIVVEAPTGSGKTTQIPQMLFEAGLDGWGMIGVTQPRRIAAFGVSKRIAQEMEANFGGLVGYKMRFDDFTTENTKIKIMTDGILLEELRSDPLLRKYSILIVDEAHERSLNIDFILGLLKEVVKERSDFKVIISSATINASLFSSYFNDAPVVSVQTEPYPIEVKYMKLKRHDDHEEILNKIVMIVEELEEKDMPGDVLIFLQGENPIKDCCQMLETLAANNHYALKILPLYARLAPEQQNRVFDPFPGFRKVVIATNIAETSITIDGIVHVIDPGYSKINYYNPRTFTSYLELKPISRASCDQRKGRAGRTAPGVVYRLYTEADYQGREEYTREEIYRTDLSEVVLRMADLGINNYYNFDFISPPNKGAINSAIETLISLDTLDENKNLTEIGKKMVGFPLGPRHSRILFEAILTYPEVVNNVLIVISFLSTKTPFLYPQGEEIESRTAQRKLLAKGGDFFTWINVFYKYQKSTQKEDFCKKYYLDTRAMKEIVNIHGQLSDMLAAKEYPIGHDFDYDKIITCIGSGLKQYICKKEGKKGNSFASPTERGVRIHPGSFMHNQSAEWLVGGEIVNTGRTYVRAGAMVSEKMIKKYFSTIYMQINQKEYSKSLKKDTLPKEGRRKALRSISTEKEPAKKGMPDKVQILDKFFMIVKDKKEQLVDVQYHIIIQLASKKDKLEKMDFGNVRARLVYKDRTILKDKLNNLLKYFDKIDLEGGISKRYPRGQFLLYPDDWNEIFSFLPMLIKPTARSKNRKKTGFLTLSYMGEDTFEYRLEGDFFNAIEASLDSLEQLFEFSFPAWNDKEKAVLEHVHHKLHNLSEI